MPCPHGPVSTRTARIWPCVPCSSHGRIGASAASHHNWQTWSWPLPEPLQRQPPVTALPAPAQELSPESSSRTGGCQCEGCRRARPATSGSASPSCPQVSEFGDRTQVVYAIRAGVCFGRDQARVAARGQNKARLRCARATWKSARHGTTPAAADESGLRQVLSG